MIEIRMANLPKTLGPGASDRRDVIDTRSLDGIERRDAPSEERTACRAGRRSRRFSRRARCGPLGHWPIIDPDLMNCSAAQYIRIT